MINPFKPKQVVFIETLIKCIKAKQDYENRRYFQVDGCIIGDGSQDFTRTYSSFALSINGGSAQLIDIPGIEGDEEKFTEIIKSALKKAHLVCYVARESKGIEENTLKKIKEYMQKNVTEMVGIHNIPLQPKLEYDGDDYVGDITREIELKNRKNRNIEEQLQRAIPDGMYRDTVGISALPGLCALAIHNGWTTIASPEKNHGNPAVAKSLGRLRDQQRTFLSRTSDAELLKASRLNKLRNVIIESCSDAPKRIKKASLIRLSRLLQDDYLADISTQKKSIGEFCNKIHKRTDSLKDNLGSACDWLRCNMVHSVKNVIYDFFYQDVLENIIYPHIEDYEGVNEDELNETLNSEKSRLNKKMSKGIKDAIAETSQIFVERIQNYVSEYQTGMELEFRNISLELPEFDAESFDFKQLGSVTMTIGSYALSGFMIGNAIPGIGTLIGTIGGVVVGAIVAFIGWFTSSSSKIKKAKNEAYDKIKDCADETWEKISSGVKKIAKDLALTVEDVVTLASKLVEEADASYGIISNLESKIKKQVKHIDAEIEQMGV